LYFRRKTKKKSGKNKGKQEINRETAKEAIPGKISRPSIQFSGCHSQGNRDSRTNQGPTGDKQESLHRSASGRGKLGVKFTFVP
jgi:hypothetical protein